LIAPKDYVHPVVMRALQEVDRKGERQEAPGAEVHRADGPPPLLSKNEVGLVAFPKPDGGFDLSGFTSSDERAMAWSRDMFTYYWGIALERSDCE